MSNNPAIVIPDQDLILAIYDFKTIFEAAIKNLFIAAGFDEGSVINSATQTDFQTIIPRVELRFDEGQGTAGAHGLVQRPGSSLPGTNGSGGFMRFNATWDGKLTIRATTNINAAGKLSHNYYRAAVLYLGVTMPYNINSGCGLTMHKIHDPVTPGGLTSVVRSKGGGFEYSDQTFNLKFSVAPAAFQTLAT